MQFFFLFFFELIYSFQLITAYDTFAMWFKTHSRASNRAFLRSRSCRTADTHFMLNKIEHFSLGCVALCVFHHRMDDVLFADTYKSNSHHLFPLRIELAWAKRKDKRNWKSLKIEHSWCYNLYVPNELTAWAATRSDVA